MLKWLFLVVLLLACSSESGPNPADQVTGVWRVSQVNGQSLPAPTASGDTFLGGYLSLNTAPIGGVDYCATSGGSPLARFAEVRWRVDQARVILTYRNLPGFSPTDTAVVADEAMHWHAKVAEAPLGTSEWDLTRVSSDPNATAPHACP